MGKPAGKTACGGPVCGYARNIPHSADTTMYLGLNANMTELLQTYSSACAAADAGAETQPLYPSTCPTMLVAKSPIANDPYGIVSIPVRGCVSAGCSHTYHCCQAGWLVMASRRLGLPCHPCAGVWALCRRERHGACTFIRRPPPLPRHHHAHMAITSCDD